MTRSVRRQICAAAALVLLATSFGRATAGQATADSKTGQAAATENYPFRDPSLPVEKRIDDLIARLTLDEKIGFLGTRMNLPRLGIKGGRIVEGIHGLAMSGPANWAHKPTIPTTGFPQGIGLGATWDPEIVRRAAAAEALEARYIFQSPKYDAGGLIVLSPNADMGRDPRWGRTEECYGEDPYLNGQLVAAFVRGLQGDDPRYWKTASLLKHFLANSNEEGRERTSSDFDERLFREYYAAPFERGIIEGGSRAYMAAYNKVNGIPMAVSPILEKVTVEEWGQNGIICTDGGAMKLLVTAHKAFPDFAHATAACIKAGITMFLDDYRAPLKEALEQKLVSEADLNRALRPNFRVLVKLGILDPPSRVPYTGIGSGPEPWLSDEHRALARLVTQKSIVLLKNEKNALPLDASAIRSIAVVGARANDVIPDWYAGTPPYAVTPLEGITKRAGSGVKVTYAPDDTNGAAVAAAKAADVAIVVVGNHPTCDGAGWGVCDVPSDGREAVDRKSISLEQESLVRAVYEANPRTIVVLEASFPYAINWSQANVPAILQIAHSSQEEGTAIADVLFGDYNPAGRLVQTWPKSIDDLPPMLDYDIRRGRTYMYFNGEPLYPFGFGLSYTTFAYSSLRTSGDALEANKAVEVAVDVTNTGKRAGEEVVQLYVTHEGSSVPRPEKALKGFRRVALAAGEKKTVRIPLAASDLAYWDEKKHAWTVEPGSVTLRVGGSSADLKLSRTLRVGR
jgi:beta-glucosidase